MARIRTVKPEFFRHEALQQLEIDYPTLHPMLVFEGLWLQSDKLGHFQWKPNILHLDILPFIKFDLELTLLLLEQHQFIKRYIIEDKTYGEVVNFPEHQRITGSEFKNDARFPLPKEYHLGNIEETLRKLPKTAIYEGETHEKLLGNTEAHGKGKGGEGKGKGEIRKGDNDKISATAEIFNLFEQSYQKINQAERDIILDFIDTYSEDKVLNAIKEGIKYNKRSLAYIEGILKGKTNGSKPAQPKISGDEWLKQHGMEP